MAPISLTKIGIVDDHGLFRKGLIKIIEGLDDPFYQIVLEAENGEDLIQKINKVEQPDILLLDLVMRSMNGFEIASWLRSDFPDIKILVISMIDTEESILKMLRLGVKGYLSKYIEPDDLANALREITSKGYYYTDFITGKLIHSLLGNQGDQLSSLDSEKFKKKELEFIKNACSELSYDEIAKKMYASPKTVDNYRDAVFKKAKVKNRAGLIIFAIKNGLVIL